MFIWVRNPHISLSLDKRQDTPIAQARLWCSFCKIDVVTLSAGSAFSAFLSQLIFVLVLFPLFPGGKFPPPSGSALPTIATPDSLLELTPQLLVLS